MSDYSVLFDGDCGCGPGDDDGLGGGGMGDDDGTGDDGTGDDGVAPMDGGDVMDGGEEVQE